MSDEKPQAEDYRSRQVIDGITSGAIGKPDRKMIREALDKADAPPTGRDARDQGLGRAIGRN